ncbi:hypothetical protein TNCV_2103571 [Trichonephila clavipes]|nr:hypothetical protein TNCV_2103571 [Trichonephila clavipes]
MMSGDLTSQPPFNKHPHFAETSQHFTVPFTKTWREQDINNQSGLEQNHASSVGNAVMWTGILMEHSTDTHYNCETLDPDSLLLDDTTLLNRAKIVNENSGRGWGEEAGVFLRS